MAEISLVRGEVEPELSACKNKPIGMVDRYMIILDPDTEIWPVYRPGGDPLADTGRHDQRTAIRGLKTRFPETA